MKTVPNKSFPGSEKNGVRESTGSLLEQALKVPPPGGFDFATMRARNRVSDAIKPDSPEIVLEDADYAVAVEAIKSTRWGANEKFLVEFAELWGL